MHANLHVALWPTSDLGIYDKVTDGEMTSYILYRICI